MIGFLGWLCYVAAAVILWLLALTVITDTSVFYAALALIATGLVLRTVTIPAAVTRAVPSAGGA